MHIAATGKMIARATTYPGVEDLEEELALFVESGTKVTEVPVLTTSTVVDTPLITVGTAVVVVKIEVLLLRLAVACLALTSKVEGAALWGGIFSTGTLLKLIGAAVADLRAKIADIE